MYPSIYHQNYMQRNGKGHHHHGHGYYPFLPFLAGLAVSPLLFQYGNHGGGHYGPNYGPNYGPHFGPQYGPDYGSPYHGGPPGYGPYSKGNWPGYY